MITNQPYSFEHQYTFITFNRCDYHLNRNVPPIIMLTPSCNTGPSPLLSFAAKNFDFSPRHHAPSFSAFVYFFPLSTWLPSFIYSAHHILSPIGIPFKSATQFTWYLVHLIHLEPSKYSQFWEETLIHLIVGQADVINPSISLLDLLHYIIPWLVLEIGLRTFYKCPESLLHCFELASFFHIFVSSF